jgi:acetylornithine/succinyldiaminopimelate/putrescine aminotransferase
MKLMRVVGTKRGKKRPGIVAFEGNWHGRTLGAQEIFYNPKQKDTLFWCLYIANNGLNAYNAITQGYSNIEMQEKKQIMESIKTQPSR